MQCDGFACFSMNIHPPTFEICDLLVSLQEKWQQDAGFNVKPTAKRFSFVYLFGVQMQCYELDFVLTKKINEFEHNLVHSYSLTWSTVRTIAENEIRLNLVT